MKLEVAEHICVGDLIACGGDGKLYPCNGEHQPLGKATEEASPGDYMENARTGEFDKWLKTRLVKKRQRRRNE